MNKISRRNFLSLFGAAAATATGTSLLSACQKKETDNAPEEEYKNQVEPPTDRMTYRENTKTGDKVSILGFGMMRLPTTQNESARTQENVNEDPIDQEMVNRQVKYALDHGVNYFDTSPAYCRGKSEEATGTALKASGYDRKSYYIATKLSNFDEATWTHEAGVEMFQNSLKYLQTDYIDYLLLHSVGGGDDCMATLNARYIDNGVLDYLAEQREKGTIRNLGFSFHGDIKVFDYLLSLNDKYHWDFVQIQLNYVDWRGDKDESVRGIDATYLQNQLDKLGIQSVIMEPLLGGRLANLPRFLVKELKARRPDKSIASWAFRFAGTPKGVLTVLSGMTYMEHVKDNILTYSPLEPITAEENEFLLGHVAKELNNLASIPCTHCNYCMPCPYGIDIPEIFAHYNKCKNEGTLPNNKENEEYRRLRRNYLIGVDRSVPKLRQAAHCIGCHQCESHCPQKIKIADELHNIDKFIDELKQDR